MEKTEKRFEVAEVVYIGGVEGKLIEEFGSLVQEFVRQANRE